MKINKKLLMAALASAVIVSAPQVKAYTLSNAESVATNTELGLSEGKQQAPARAPQKASDPNYANDEKNVGSYKETQLERGNGPATIYTPPTEMDKFIDGFRYSTVEPGATSPDKTLWGFEIEFDRDQGQRTYTDFSFTNAGNMGGYLDTGSIPAKSPEDGSLGDNFKTPNYKASTEIAITGSRAQRNLNGYATEKDLQHINNVDNNNTTMAWEGHYSKDNTSAPFATKGSSSAFGFTVNPWPNENDQLDLITLSGEHTNREFVNGQKITTGVKVANLDDSARERLVGQVYHPSTGEVVPGAKAYIDDKGNVVVEMPKGAVDEKGNINEDSIFYKDPNYKGIQNLEVKFFARPRTAEEFKAIAGEYSGTYTETGAGTETINHKGESITIDKQGIARYDHYNLVGKFNLNIDDTAFHDQTYRNKDIKTGKIVDTTSQSAIGIRRGETLDVDNQTSKDEMDGLVKDKNAHAKIDTTFFDKENAGKDSDDQWKLTYNEELSNIKVTAPKYAKAGSYVALPITYTYTNGSTDVKTFFFVVQDDDNKIPEYETQVAYPQETQKSLPSISQEEKDKDKLEPVSYSIPEGTEFKDDHDNEWNVSIDETTGEITATPKDPSNFNGGERLKVPVVAHYKNKLKPELKITEDVRADFVIKERFNKTPNYNAKAGKAGEILSSDVIINTDDQYNRDPGKFTIESNTYTDDKGNEWVVTIDQTTGKVTATVPNPKDGNSIDGAIINVPVTAYYYEKDGKEVGTRQVDVQFIATGTTGTHEKIIEIPFETKVEKNPKLKKGEILVVQEGKVGSKKVTYTIKDSKVIKEEETELIYPQDRLIQVGEGVNDGTHKIEEKSEVPYDIEIEFSDDLKPGEQEVVQEGVPGEKTRTTTLTIEDGKVTKTEEGEYQQNKAPINKKIKVGRNTEGKVEHKEEIPFKYTVEYDPNVEAGKYVVETPGKNGERVTTWTIKNSEIVGDPSVAETKPVDAVIKVGNKDFTGTFETKKTEPVEFETEYRVNKDLQPGEVKEIQKGELGEKETTVTHTIKNGEVTESVEGETKQTKAPVKRIVEVGPGKTDGTHTIEEKEEVPFEVEIQFDDSLAPGEQKVTQEGVPGEKTRTTTLTIENSEVINTEVGKFEVTKEPVKKIIKVGRNTEGEVKHVEEIPFKYTVNEVDTLKKGEYEIVKPGKVGSKTTTWKIENSEIVGEPKTEIVEAEDAIINVGKGTNDGTHEVVEKVPVPFETIIEFDDSLKPGETKVTQEGEPGEKTRTTTLTIQDGKVTNTESSEYEQNKAPLNRIIKVGRNTDGEVVHKEEIPFKYTVEYDPELKAGEYKVETPGRNGERITTWTIKNSKVDGDPKVVETQPIDAVIKVGNKDFTGEFKTTKTEAVEFETEYRVNNELKPGEVREVQKGELGEKETEVTHTIKNGEVIESKEGETKQTKAPVKRIVEVGPGTTDGTYEKIEEIPFETKVEKDPTLKKGEIKVITEGEKGSKKVTYTIKDSKVDETKTKEEVIKEATDRVIHVGEGVNDGTHKITEEVDVPFETKIEFDDSLKPGEQKVTQEGEPGKKSRDITLTIQDGEVTNTQEGEFTQTKAPKDRIIKVGRNTEGKVEHKEEIPFGYKVEEVEDLKKGEYRIVKPGKVGTKTTTWIIKNSQIDGEPTVTEEAPEDALIQVGKGTNDGTHEIVEKKEIPFETRYEYDDSLEPGEEKIVTPGSPGEQERTNKLVIKDGKVVEVKEGEFKTTKEPQERLIKIGRKPTEGEITKTIEREIPYETKVIYDDTLEAGFQKIEKEGKPGKEEVTITQKVKDSKPVGDPTETTKTITEKEDRVVRIGVKPVVKETEIPGDTEYRYNPELKEGEEKVIEEGSNGKVEYTITFNKEKGKIEVTEKRTEPTNKIVEIGYKTDGKVKVESEIPFEVEIIEDPEMEAGKTEVVQEGELGKKETTITVVNSEEVSRKEDIIKEPVKKIIKVGTKNVCEIPPVDPDPETPGKPGDKDPETPGKPGDKDPETPDKPGGKDPKDPGKTPENNGKTPENNGKTPENNGKTPGATGQVDGKSTTTNNKTPKRLPKSGSESEIMTLAMSGLLTAAGFIGLKKKRKDK